MNRVDKEKLIFRFNELIATNTNPYNDFRIERAIALEDLKREIESGNFDIKEDEELTCPNGCDKGHDVGGSHTWTADGNTYFKSYVYYCPTCLYIIKTKARL